MKVFLDHASTTPVRSSAIEALNTALLKIGNPSSVHSHGQSVRADLEDARDELSKAINCNRSEVIFNSGGTESNNQAIKGIYWSRNQDQRRQVIISAATEHHALIDPIEWLVQHEGAVFELVKVFPSGMVDLQHLEELVALHGDNIALISLMWVNNETGVITDIAKVCEIAGEIPVHSDAVAALGHVPTDFAGSGLTAMSISGHKVGAPIGVGALIVSRSFKPVSLLHGGGQERGLRSGTMNYPMAKAFAVAALEAVSELEARQAALGELRDEFENRVLEAIPSARRSAEGAKRAEHNSNLIFPGVRSDSILFLLDQQGLSVSSGSACQAGVLGPSHVLYAMGHSEGDASSCLRVTLGHTTTRSDIEFAIAAITSVHAPALAASAIGT